VHRCGRVQDACQMRLPTDAVYLQIYPRAHDLVPAVDAPYQPAGAIEASRSAKRMHKGCCRCEVVLYRSTLLLRWTLAQLMDDMRDLGDCKRVSASRS